MGACRFREVCGTSALPPRATVQISGSEAWSLIRHLFHGTQNCGCILLTQPVWACCLGKDPEISGGALVRLRMCCLLTAVILHATGGIQCANSQPVSASDHYTTHIQPIFDNRCAACHSCYNAPCQLNLQSHSGLTRGATKLNIYDRSRLKSVAPADPKA